MAAEGPVARITSAVDLFLQRWFLAIDFCVSSGAFLILLGINACRPFVSVPAGMRSMLYSTTVSLCGSLLGFLISAVSIIIALASLPQFQILKDSGALPQLYQVYFQAIFWLGAATAWAFAAMLIDTDASPHPWVGWVQFWLLLVAAIRTYRSVRYLRKMTVAAAAAPADADRARAPEPESAFG